MLCFFPPRLDFFAYFLSPPFPPKVYTLVFTIGIYSGFFLEHKVSLIMALVFGLFNTLYFLPILSSPQESLFLIEFQSKYTFPSD